MIIRVGNRDATQEWRERRIEATGGFTQSVEWMGSGRQALAGTKGIQA